MNETSSASGTSMPRCQKCGAVLRPGYSFCAECGAPAAPSASPKQPAADAEPRTVPHFSYTPPQAEATASARRSGARKAAAPRFRKHFLLYIVIGVLAAVALLELVLLFGGASAPASSFSPHDFFSNGSAAGEDFSFSESDAKAVQSFADYRDGYADFSVSEPVLLLRQGEKTEVKLTLKHYGTALYYDAPQNLDLSVGKFTPLIGQTCTVSITALDTGVSTVTFTNSANREELKMLVIVVN